MIGLACFVPSEGNVFVKADYSTVELATLAQVMIGQFGQRSFMGEAINNGQDLHRLVAGYLVHKKPEEVTVDERQKAKPINFGKPGGMGHDGLKNYAKTSYGADPDRRGSRCPVGIRFVLFPEMEAFLDNGQGLGQEVAAAFGLTPQAHYEHTGEAEVSQPSCQPGP